MMETLSRRRMIQSLCGGLGSVGEKAASALADFIVVDMFANVCAGREDAKAAIRIAERQAMRLYR